MSAEFHITSDSGALGELPHVREVISDTFLEIQWKSSSGTASHGDGVIEFDLSSQPVDVVWIRVHDCDPSRELLTVCRRNGWKLFDDSSGEEVSEADDAAPLEEIEPIPTSPLTSEGPLRVTRQKRKTPFPPPGEPYCPMNLILLIEFKQGEIAFDIFDEYSRYMKSTGLIGRTNRHPKCRNEELVLLGEGVRIAILYSSADANEGTQFCIDKYCEVHKRRRGNISDGIVYLDGHSLGPTTSFEMITRAYRRAIGE